MGWPAAGRGARARPRAAAAGGGGVEGEEAAEAMRRAAAKAKMAMLSSATGCTAPSGPKIVHPDMRTSRCPGALRGARAHFEMPGPEGAPYQQKAMNRTPLCKTIRDPTQPFAVSYSITTKGL